MIFSRDTQIKNLATITWNMNKHYLPRCLVYLAHKRCELLEEKGPECEMLFRMWTEVEREIIHIARRAGEFNHGA